MIKKIISQLLAGLARRIIKKYRPRVIGISGSIGKTGVKEYVNFVLQTKFRTRASFKNYNNELGLPLSILGLTSPGRNLKAWLSVFFQAFKLLLFKDKNFPEVLILEMGVDRVGDMDYLLSIVRPDIGLLSHVSHSHLEHFGSLERIKKEKAKLVKNLNRSGTAILNFDNIHLRNLSRDIKGQVRTWTYGLDSGADFWAKDIVFSWSSDQNPSSFCGFNFKLEHRGSIVPVSLPQALSYSSIYSALAAVAVGLALDLNLIELAAGLNQAISIPGRMNVLTGIKNSIIIDDSYNASPDSTLNALAALARLDKGSGRKIAVLGDMLELGEYSLEGHRLIGRKIAELDLDHLFLIGSQAQIIGQEAVRRGWPENNISNFSRVEEALDFIRNGILERDLILVKASQGVRLEKAVKAIIAESDRAGELLVRQGPEWTDS